ncbi:MAG: hypothetical protein EZS28_010939 [Streblomastix strix]|uniref:Reverse transcriptase domain-containing protein n=1 Tax=Streblomastix strix TaxID=222440 RepID=A0A5J4WEX0_9EUKA|nr:MAG: hypothetical protein EZS28_010939 [Streblomastix strix]
MVLNVADVSRKENINPNNLANSNRHKEILKNQIEDQKFKKLHKIEFELRIVKQVHDCMITNFYSTYVIQKKGSKWSKELNSRKLNKLTQTAHFEIDNGIIMTLITNLGDFAKELDVEKAYNHIQTSKELQRFLGFKYREKAQTYSTISFDWNMSFQIFCFIMNKILKLFRIKFKIRVASFIDNFLLLSRNKKRLEQDKKDMILFI